jgi:16S rRNA (uracil1498-N3)-methyltransferase
VVVGPEGGLTAEEVRGLVEVGAVVAGLGPRALRTETAGPVAVALLQSRYGDLGRS